MDDILKNTTTYLLFYYYFYIINILQYPIIFFTNILHNKQRNKKYPYFLL